MGPVKPGDRFSSSLSRAYGDITDMRALSQRVRPEPLTVKRSLRALHGIVDVCPFTADEPGPKAPPRPQEVVYTPSRRWGLAELAPPPRAMGCHSSILAETCPNRSPKCYFEGPGIALAGRRRCRGDPEATRPRSRRRALVGSGSWEPPPTTGGRRRAPPRLSSQSWWSRDPRTRRGRQCRGCSAEMRDPEDTGGKRSYNGSEDRSEQA